MRGIVVNVGVFGILRVLCLFYRTAERIFAFSVRRSGDALLSYAFAMLIGWPWTGAARPIKAPHLRSRSRLAEQHRPPKNGRMLQPEITLLELLQQERETELAAAAAYPFRTDKCSASLGRPLPQKAYACLTCGGGRGYCYACHVECHPEHEVIEVGARRSFTCDCARYGDCRLLKATLPQASTYNSAHNFEGRFCTCRQFCPDDTGGADELEEESTMFQCLCCEDWLHDRCLRDLPEDVDSFVEFVCAACVAQYGDISNRHADAAVADGHSLYLKESWREAVCRCAECAAFFDTSGLSPILSPEPLYEPERDMRAGESLYELGVKALSNIPPDKLDIGLSAMKQLKNAFSARLKEIEAENRVVTKEDIEAFFADFNADHAMQHPR